MLLACSSPGVWQRQGTIITGLQANGYAAQEPMVLYEGSPQLLTATGNIFKLWWTCGWDKGGLCYAESSDGMTWVHYQNDKPIIIGVAHGFVVHSGSGYLYYGANLFSGDNAWDQYTSTDGIHWSLAHSSVLTVGDRPWDAWNAGNIDVFSNGSTWYALFEADDSSNVWRIGIASSPDGVHWKKYGANPVIQNAEGGMCGGPEAHLVSGVWYVWAQCAPTGPPDYLPSDIYRFHSTDLYHWKLDPSSAALARETGDEGASNGGGQVADPTLVQVNGSTFMFYDATPDQTWSNSHDAIHIKLVTAPMPMSDLVTTREGSGGGR